ncbi:hypothetical protein [Agrobacterium tumefaciens]|uniref:hypothetical protein n=1 Tax=Agrobacterium tumefaciens TaxID=358 RepID=UPI00157181D5|nr:hypothetical protein [Agrobacterium tumefaciens]WCK69524.1 hypothetical protein G6L23_026990 [Agrobacterium tumefaciens]
MAAPASFFFESENKAASEAHPYEDLVAFIESPEGTALNQAFAEVKNAAVRARIVALVKAIGKDHPSALVNDR